LIEYRLARTDPDTGLIKEEPIWKNLADHCRLELAHDYSGGNKKKFREVVAQELEKFNADHGHTDMGLFAWFPDEETLAQFLLTWS
jgi:hypothetical protein